MKAWKRNAVIATVLVFICAGVYLNWSYNQKEKTPGADADTERGAGNGGDDHGDRRHVGGGRAGREHGRGGLFRAGAPEPAGIARQRVELLEETIAYDEGTAVGDTASATLNTLVNTALSEAQIESMVIAKGFADCVTYITDDTVSVAVAAPAEGLSEADAALISDVVCSQTDYPLSQVRIIEVKP